MEEPNVNVPLFPQYRKELFELAQRKLPVALQAGDTATAQEEQYGDEHYLEAWEGDDDADLEEPEGLQ